MSEVEALEIQALAKIMDELDYYQILRIQPGVATPEIKRAYYESSRSFHPDARRDLDAPLRAQCEKISKRVTEAYCVLRDPRRRRVYDELLANESGVRVQLAEASAAHKRKQSQTLQGKTPQGRQFLQRAMQDVERDNPKSAIQNLQMALTFEPGNAAFQAQLDALRSKD